MAKFNNESSYWIDSKQWLQLYNVGIDSIMDFSRFGVHDKVII